MPPLPPRNLHCRQPLRHLSSLAHCEPSWQRVKHRGFSAIIYAGDDSYDQYDGTDLVPVRGKLSSIRRTRQRAVPHARIAQRHVGSPDGRLALARAQSATLTIIAHMVNYAACRLIVTSGGAERCRWDGGCIRLAASLADSRHGQGRVIAVIRR